MRLSALYQSGGLLTALVTTLLAFLIGGLVVLVTTGSNPLETYKAIFDGTGLNWLFPWEDAEERVRAARRLQATLLLTTSLILTGLAVAFAFRCGLFNIGGPGPVHARRDRRRLDRHVAPGAPWLRAHPAGARHGGAGRGVTRRHRRDPEGDGGRARGDRHDHAQLDRLLVRDVPVRPPGAAAEHAGVRPVEPRLGRHRPVRAPSRVLGEPDPPGPPHRVLHRHRRPRLLLGDPEPDDPRLRGARGRVQPRSGALWRHQRRAQLLPRHGDLRRVCRPRGRDRHPRLAVPARRQRRPDLDDRVHRDRSRLARAKHGRRRRLRRSALRRAPDRDLDAKHRPDRRLRPEPRGQPDAPDPGSRRALRGRGRPRPLSLERTQEAPDGEREAVAT